MDQRLRGIAVRRAVVDAEEANLLRYAEELKLWRGFACDSMIEYMERAMGYAPHTAAERLRVARALGGMPLIAEALEKGELAHSAVRELLRVAIAETEDAWLEAARGKSLREVEKLVAGHKPGDLPTDETEPRLHRRTITIEVSPETYDIWRRMHALAAEEHGQRLSDDELIPSVFRRAYGGGVAGGGEEAGSPAYKIAIKQCPDCKRAWQYSGGRDIEIDPAVAECAACDAIHLGSLDAAVPERVTASVTARKREQVLARDGYCCTVPGCRRSVGLDLHHIEYQRRGGSHDLQNLTVLCSLHHQAVHYGKLVIWGIAPDGVTFEFRRPRDRRNLTDDDPAEAGAASGQRVAYGLADVEQPLRSSAAGSWDLISGGHGPTGDVPMSLADDPVDEHLPAATAVRPAPDTVPRSTACGPASASSTYRPAIHDEPYGVRRGAEPVGHGPTGDVPMSLAVDPV